MSTGEDFLYRGSISLLRSCGVDIIIIKLCKIEIEALFFELMETFSDREVLVIKSDP